MAQRKVATIVLLLTAGAVLLLPSTPAVAGTADPRPIPGGIQIPNGPLIHVWAPGPKPAGLMGLEVEPNTITDFRGFVAMAYHLGRAKGSDGVVYDMVTDMRAFRGTYVGLDGRVHRGSFVLI